MFKTNKFITYILLLTPYTKLKKKKNPHPCLLHLSLSILTDNERTESDILLQFLLPWICVFLPTWEGQLCILIWIISSFLSVYFNDCFVGNIHGDQLYPCLRILDWFLEWDFEYAFKKLGRISQMIIGGKVMKRKTCVPRIFSSFKPLRES